MCIENPVEANFTDVCVSNGVKQGIVILPLLFSNHMDALFKQLNRSVYEKFQATRAKVAP